MKLHFKEPENKNISISLVPSKSISNRALIIKNLCSQNITLQNLSKANDTLILNNCLQSKTTTKYIGAAGTAARFLCSYLATKENTYILFGDKRMNERPMKELIEALRTLGAEILCTQKKGFLPIRLNGKHTVGGVLNIDASISSQFISALLLIAPALKKGLKITLKNAIVSFPYIQMTVKIMQHFDIHFFKEDSNYYIPQQTYKAKNLFIENDWTSASYFYSCLALCQNNKLIYFFPNLFQKSWQGDAMLTNIFDKLGVKTTHKKNTVYISKKEVETSYFSYNFINCPDIAQTLICTCVGLNIEGEFKGLDTLKHKETNRIKAMQTELKKLNWILEEKNSSYYLKKIGNIPLTKTIYIETYTDHRMAMSFAPLSIVYKSINIKDPMVCKKSFPNFWNELKKVGIQSI